MRLIDDILGQPVAWLGIEEAEKKTKLSEIQNQLDNITDSLVQYSESGKHEYFEECKLQQGAPRGLKMCPKMEDSKNRSPSSMSR